MIIHCLFIHNFFPSGITVLLCFVQGGVGTVGAVAIDVNGNVAVATSTGGMSGKAVGRIGDTPQIGSGTYADNNIGGVSTTGKATEVQLLILKKM